MEQTREFFTEAAPSVVEIRTKVQDVFFCFFKLQNQGFCGANPISGYPVTSFELVGKRGINRIESWLCESVGLDAAGIYSAL